jgi:hypothetical protein
MATSLRPRLRGVLAGALTCAFWLATAPARAQEAAPQEPQAPSVPAEAQPAPAVPAPASALPEKPAAVAAPAGMAATTPAQPSADSRGAGMRWSGIVIGSVGVAGIVTGVIFSLETRSIANQVTSDNARHTYDRSKDDRGRRYSNFQWMGYTLGAALLVDGGFLYYLGYREAHAPAADSLSFAPVLLPGGTGAVLQGRF